MTAKIRIRKRRSPWSKHLLWGLEVPGAYGPEVIWMSPRMGWQAAIDEANYIINGWGKFS